MEKDKTNNTKINENTSKEDDFNKLLAQIKKTENRSKITIIGITILLITVILTSIFYIRFKEESIRDSFNEEVNRTNILTDSINQYLYELKLYSKELSYIEDESKHNKGRLEVEKIIRNKINPLLIKLGSLNPESLEQKTLNENLISNYQEFVDLTKDQIKSWEDRNNDLPRRIEEEKAISLKSLSLENEIKELEISSLENEINDLKHRIRILDLNTIQLQQVIKELRVKEN